jgi:hypothetical protein
MRNNRGEWDYREPYDKDNFKFVRNSGIKQWELEDKRGVLSEVIWLGIALAFTVAVSCLIAFTLGYISGGV